MHRGGCHRRLAIRIGHGGYSRARDRDLESGLAAARSTRKTLHERGPSASRRGPTALLGHFEAEEAEARGRPASTPIETVEAMFEGAGHHFPMIEAEGEAAIPVVLEGAAGMDDPATRTLGARWLRAYAADAARLPLAVMRPAAEAAGYDPAALLGLGGGERRAGASGGWRRCHGRWRWTRGRRPSALPSATGPAR